MRTRFPSKRMQIQRQWKHIQPTINHRYICNTFCFFFTFLSRNFYYQRHDKLRPKHLRNWALLDILDVFDYKVRNGIACTIKMEVRKKPYKTQITDNLNTRAWYWNRHRPSLDWPVSLPRVRQAKRSESRRVPLGTLGGPLIGHKLDTGWQGRLGLLGRPKEVWSREQGWAALFT